MGEQFSALWELYSHGRTYAKTLGITDQIPQNIDFYEGRQWAKPTEATKNMPRPVINITKMIVRNKKAGILGGKVKLVFSNDNEPDRADEMTAFNECIEKEMGMEKLRSRLVDSGAKKGSGFLHYYWDSEAVGAQGRYSGGVRGEIIDPLNIFFANPTETDEQKQKWILISSRVDVVAAKAMAAKGTDTSLITADSSEKHYNEPEQEGLTTVLTRYFRQGGEVFYEKATKSVMLHKPRALNPKTNFAVEIQEDAPEGELPDAAEEMNLPPQPKATLYPIVAYSYEPREMSIFGLSEVEDVIPNQKSINFNIGMQLLSVQNQAWGKYIVRSGALKDQQINNVPGQVLYDYSPEGNGIKKLTEQPFSNMPLQLVDTLTSLTRTVTGSSEVMTGESASTNQSGAAIAQLQAEALKPVAELKEQYWQACINGGKILEQFYRLFYEGYFYTHKTDDETINSEFYGEDYDGIDFSLNVEAGAGTQFSEALVISLLNQLLDGGRIDFDTFVELFPISAMPFKASLISKIEAKKASDIARLTSAVQTLQQQLLQAQEIIQQLSKGQQTA